MKFPRLLAVATALALVVSPLTWAKGSGFSSSRSSSSFSRSYSYSSPSRSSSWSSSTSSSSSTSRSSGFSSGASASGKSAAATGLGSTLYAAHASKAAADTYTRQANAGAGAGTARPSGSQMASDQTASGYAAAPSRAATYQPTEVHHYHTVDTSSSSNNFLLGYMLGRSGERRDTVVVQQAAPAAQYAPAQYTPQPAGVVTPEGVQPAATQALPQPQAQPSSTSSAAPAKPSQSDFYFMRVVAWLLVIGGVAFVGYQAFKHWSVRKARYTSTNHYKL